MNMRLDEAKKVIVESLQFRWNSVIKDVKLTVPGAIARVLDDYNPDTDALSVCFNKDGKITMDDKLDSWATDVMSEWTDAFGCSFVSIDLWD